MISRVLPAWLIGAVLVFANAALAQNFSTIDLGLGGLVVPGEEYEGIWDAKNGVSGFVSSNFLGGQLGLSARVFSNEDALEGLPEFLAIHGTLGWGATVTLPANAELTGGGRIGAMNMRFEEDEVFFGGLQNETEITAGVFVHGEIPMLQHLAVFVDIEWTRMYLERPVTFVFVEAGVRVRIDAPSWLKEVLQ